MVAPRRFAWAYLVSLDRICEMAACSTDALWGIKGGRLPCFRPAALSGASGQAGSVAGIAGSRVEVCGWVVRAQR